MWLCGEHHLPASGSVQDQDAGLMARMRAVENIYRACLRLREAGRSIERLHALGTQDRKIIKALMQMGLIHA